MVSGDDSNEFNSQPVIMESQTTTMLAYQGSPNLTQEENKIELDDVITESKVKMHKKNLAVNVVDL